MLGERVAPGCRPRDWRREGRIAVLTVWVRAVGKVRVPSRPTSRAKKVGLQGLPWTRNTYAYFELADDIHQWNLLSIDCKLCPLINTPLTIIRLQTKLKLTNCNPNYKFEIAISEISVTKPTPGTRNPGPVEFVSWPTSPLRLL